MLSRKSGQLFETVLKWCYTYGGMPFIWNGRRGRVTLTSKGKQRWAAAIIFQLISCIYIAFRISQIAFYYARGLQFHTKIGKKLSWSSPSLYKFTNLEVGSFDIGVAYCLVYIMVHAYSIALFINTIRNSKELILFINSYLKFITFFRGKAKRFNY